MAVRCARYVVPAGKNALLTPKRAQVAWHRRFCRHRPSVSRNVLRGKRKTGKGIFAARCRFEAAHIRTGQTYLCRKLHVSIPCSVISLPPSAALRHEGIRIPSGCGNRHVFAELSPYRLCVPLPSGIASKRERRMLRVPPLPSPAPADTIRQGFGDSSGVPRSGLTTRHRTLPRAKAARLYPEALETPIRGLLGRSGNLALRGCPARRAPCGRTREHPPLPSVAGDSGLPMSATSADGYRRCSFSLSLNTGRDDRG